VTGRLDIKHLKKNSTAQVGDLLFLTKPLGIGILGTAMKRGLLRDEDYSIFLNTMIQLNSIGSELGKLTGVHALTDVTGFGLMGHLIEMCEGSEVSAEIEMAKVPLIHGIEFYTNQFCFPDNTTRNLNSYKDKVGGMNGLEFISLCDPQTSGGLLVSLSPESVLEYFEIVKRAKLPELAMTPIGKIISKAEKCVTVI
jgi:selenide,water dikinase